jgi:hypothetical protein
VLGCFLPTAGSIRKAAIAGLCGSGTHSLLMFAKAQLGILDSFQPYQSLQIALIHWTGDYVHPAVPWLISFLNGSTLASFAFARLYRHLPGSGPIKGLVSGVLGWLVMDLVFFPLLGLGPFGTQVGLGMRPAVFSLFMMLTYSIALGIAYSMFEAESVLRPKREIAPDSRREVKVGGARTTRNAAPAPRSASCT